MSVQSREQIKLADDLNILEKIRISYPSMPYKLYFKIRFHLINISKKRKKTGISLLINGIPDTIKTDLLFKIYSKIINEFSIFKNIKNSNFILQVLTSFIPITLKKEEIVLYEGEIVENIIFVKDGRLSMEITIDLKDPYTSIQKYLEVNFIGINRTTLNKLNELKSVNSLMSKKNINYNDLKDRIDNFLLDHQKIINNKALLDYISTDLGKLELTKNEIDAKHSKNFENIKIFDLRKNENFGEVHMFEEKPSPFTLKTKSRIVEIFLLHKSQAMGISINFPNLWKKIHNVSYYNLVSLKSLTYKILKQYYNSHFYNKNKKVNNLNLTIDHDSFISLFDKNFFSKIKSEYSRKSVGQNEYKRIKTTKESFKNKLFENNIKKRKSSFQVSNNKIKIKNDSSFNSSISSFKCIPSNEIQRINISSKDNNINENTDYNSNKNKKCIKNKENEKFTFRNDNNILDNTLIKNCTTDKSLNNDKKINDISQLITSKNDKNNTSIEYYKEFIPNINEPKKENENNLGTLINQSIRYENEEDNNSSNEEEKIFTLKDINKNFSNKIRKKLKMRKKIDKLKHSLELRRKDNSRNLIELYTNIINKKLKLISKNNELSKNIAEELVNKTFNKNDSELFSKFLDSMGSEEYSIKKFNNYSLKIIESESFQINSYYKNMNELSKGEIINNLNAKKFFESLIEKNMNKKNFKKVHFKISSRSSKNNINKQNPEKSKNILLNNKTKNATNTNLNKPNLIIKNNFNEKPIKKKCKTKLENKLNTKNNNKNKNDSNDVLLENSLINVPQKKENKERKKNNKIKNHILNTINENKKFFQHNNLEIFKKTQSNNNTSNSIHNKSYSSSLNFINEIDKDNISKSENKIQILNKNNYMDNSSLKIIHIHDNNKKILKCIVF